MWERIKIRHFENSILFCEPNRVAEFWLRICVFFCFLLQILLEIEEIPAFEAKKLKINETTIRMEKSNCKRES